MTVTRRRPRPNHGIYDEINLRVRRACTCGAVLESTPPDAALAAEDRWLRGHADCQQAREARRPRTTRSR